MTTTLGLRKLEPRTPFAALKIASALSSVPLASCCSSTCLTNRVSRELRYALICGASSSISSEIGRIVAILRTWAPKTSPKTSELSGFTAASAVGAAALVRVVSLTYLTGLRGATWFGITSAK